MDESLLKNLMEGQRQYFLSGETRDPKFLKRCLTGLCQSLRRHESELLQALHADLNKSPFEAFTCELGLVYKEISHQKRLISRYSRPQRVPRSLLTLNGRSRILYEPYGQTLIVSPWNYPVNLTLIPLVGAVAAGNVVVLKVSPDSPHTNRVLAEIQNESFSSSHVAMVEGHREVNTMLFDQKWNHIFLTGSPEMGRVAMTAAARHLTPVTLELGGKSPCIVFQDADIRAAAKKIVFGKLVNSGQTCIAPDYLLVHRSVKDRLVQEIRCWAARLYGEDPIRNPQYPHIVNDKAMTRLVSYLGDGHILMGGRYDLERRAIEPTLIDAVREDSPLLSREIFGPILPVIEFDTEEQIYSWLSEREKPLALYCFTSSRRRALRLLRHTSSGGACVNDTLMHIVNPRLPFGGVQNSGIGRYHGRYSFECFSHVRSVFCSGPIDIWFKYPPFTDFRTAIVKKFMR